MDENRNSQEAKAYREFYKNMIDDYNEWAKHMRIISNKGIVLIMVMGFLGAYYFENIKISRTLFMASLGIAAIGIGWLSCRKSHMEGYVAGYETGVNDGADKARGIDQDMRNFLNEIEIDRESNKTITMNQKKEKGYCPKCGMKNPPDAFRCCNENCTEILPQYND